MTATATIPASALAARILARASARTFGDLLQSPESAELRAEIVALSGPDMVLRMIPYLGGAADGAPALARNATGQGFPDCIPAAKVDAIARVIGSDLLDTAMRWDRAQGRASDVAQTPRGDCCALMARAAILATPGCFARLILECRPAGLTLAQAARLMGAGTGRWRVDSLLCAEMRAAFAALP